MKNQTEKSPTEAERKELREAIRRYRPFNIAALMVADFIVQ